MATISPIVPASAGTTPETTRRSSALTIVPATRDDMTLVAGFVRSSAEWYRPIVDEKDMGEHAVDEAWAEENFTRRDFYIGSADGEPVGTISLQYFGSWAYLGYIYLDVAHVGRGFGGKLIRFAEQKAREAGMQGLSLIGHPKATWAKRAYLKYGFEIAASKKNDVLGWQGGVLKPYYEEDFELYLYSFDEERARA